MNREEAIKILSQMRKDGEGFLSDDTIEAYDMAIEALEAESESRMSYVQETVNAIMNTCDTDSIKDKAMRNAARFVQNAIDGSYPDFEELEQESCGDCISRQAVLNYIRDNYRRWFINDDAFMQCVNGIRDIVAVTPQPKMGRWIFDEILDKHYYCSECKSMGVDYWDYCPNCGCKMQEVE